MKKKILFGIAMLLILGGLLEGCGDKTKTGKEGDTSSKKEAGKLWGKKQKDMEEKLAEEIYLKGKEAVITMKEYEQTVYFFTLQNLEEKEAREKADAYVKESAALGVEARKKGYTATEEEVQAHIRDLQNTEGLDEASKKLMDDVIEGYGGADEYWEYETKLYRILLPIEKMVSDLQTQFYKDHPEENFQEWYDQYKQDLVKKEFS